MATSMITVVDDALLGDGLSGLSAEYEHVSPPVADARYRYQVWSRKEFLLLHGADTSHQEAQLPMITRGSMTIEMGCEQFRALAKASGDRSWSRL